ncbi:hypothetical protein Leryth_023118 [Lithospermum erythrorhizon]|nr:hypothetical protein Leryth_023118 [Lithospermum erythrorhizon]
MEYRNLYLKLISASGLKEVNRIRKMDVYAKAYLRGYKKTKQKTKCDKNCGTNPTWNHQMHFIIDEHSLTAPGLALIVRVKADVVGKDKRMGEVSIPIPQLFDDCGKTAGVERFMDYHVKTSSGKFKGTLKLSCLFGEKYRLLNTYSSDITPDGDILTLEGISKSSVATHNGYAARYPTPAHPHPRPHHGPYSPTGGHLQQASSNGCGVYAPAPSPGYEATAASGYVYCRQHQPMMQNSSHQDQPVQENGGKDHKKKIKIGKRGGGIGLGVLGVSAGLIGGKLEGDLAGDVGEIVDTYMISSSEEMVSGVGEATSDEAGEMVDGADDIGDMVNDAEDIVSSGG